MYGVPAFSKFLRDRRMAEPRSHFFTVSEALQAVLDQTDDDAEEHLWDDDDPPPAQSPLSPVSSAATVQPIEGETPLCSATQRNKRLCLPPPTPKRRYVDVCSSQSSIDITGYW